MTTEISPRRSLMSRGEAKRRLSLDDMKDQMKNIWTSSVCEETLDEPPGAYKPMQAILDAIGDAAEIVGTIKPIYNFKATEPGDERKEDDDFYF